LAQAARRAADLQLMSIQSPPPTAAAAGAASSATPAAEESSFARWKKKSDTHGVDTSGALM